MRRDKTLALVLLIAAATSGPALAGKAIIKSTNTQMGGAPTGKGCGAHSGNMIGNHKDVMQTAAPPAGGQSGGSAQPSCAPPANQPASNSVSGAPAGR